MRVFSVDFQAKGWLLEDEATANARQTQKQSAASDGEEEDAVALDTDPRSAAQRLRDAKAAEREEDASHTLDSDMYRMAKERKEWERKALAEIMEGTDHHSLLSPPFLRLTPSAHSCVMNWCGADRLGTERALSGPDTGIKQNYEKALSAEEKRLLQEVEQSTREARDKHVQLKLKRKTEADKRR
jgi:hypothetical protein